MRNQFGEFLELVVDLLFCFLTVCFVSRQPQSDTQCAGQIGQVQIGGQSLFPRSDRVGQNRFSQSKGDDRTVYIGIQSEMFAQTR